MLFMFLLPGVIDLYIVLGFRFQHLKGVKLMEVRRAFLFVGSNSDFDIAIFLFGRS